MRALRLASALLACILLSACSDELTRSQAEDQLREHFESIAPNTFDDQIMVEDILIPDEINRQVRFRLVDTSRDSAGVAPVDSTGVMAAFFQRSDRGWSIGRYGEDLRRSIATTVAFEWRESYADLLDVLDHLRDEKMAWIEEQQQAAWRAIDRGRATTADRYITGSKFGPRYEDLADRIAADAIPDDMEWGIFQPRSQTQDRVIWVRTRADTTVICTLPAYIVGRSKPSEFAWIDDFLDSCRGKERPYPGFVDSMERVERLMDEGGGVLTP